MSVSVPCYRRWAKCRERSGDGAGSEGEGEVEEIVVTDIEYVNKVQQYGKQIGRSLDLAFHAVKFPQSLDNWEAGLLY